MEAKLLLVLLLAIAANGMPKLSPRLKEEIAAKKVSSLLMPGPVLLPNKNSVEVAQVDVSPECVVCEFIMTKLDEMLSQNSTEEEIKEALKKVCSLLPPSVRGECTEFVDEYADMILQYLSQGVSAKVVCTYLKLCSNTVQELPNGPNDVVAISQIGDSTECELCQAIAKQIESLITQNSTQQEIEEALEQVCDLLPTELKSQCNQFVETYLPEILNLLALEITPDMLCKELGLCTSMKVIEDDQMDPMTPMQSNLTCDFCEKIIGLAKELASKNDTEQDVEKLLKLVCYYMLPIIQECKDFIDNIIPEIFDELKKMDPDAICKQLNMCPKSNAHNDVRCFLKDITRCFKP